MVAMEMLVYATDGRAEARCSTGERAGSPVRGSVRWILANWLRWRTDMA